MRVLVTGAGGFSGRHLIEYLKQDASCEIYCTSLMQRTDHCCRPCDLTDPIATKQLIEDVAPDQIYHLAGINSNEYDAAYRANVLTTRNLLEATAAVKSECRVLLVGSSAEYGLVEAESSPVSEAQPLAPMSTYGLTKVYQTVLMNFYRARHRLDIVMARTFNLMGVGMPVTLFVGRVYEQISAYRAGTISKIVVGNLDHRRDYIPVETAVRYYALIMERGAPGETYNVGSGTSVKMRDLLRGILAENGLAMSIIDEQRPMTPNKFDIRDLVANITKLQALAGDSSAISQPTE